MSKAFVITAFIVIVVGLGAYSYVSLKEEKTPTTKTTQTSRPASNESQLKTVEINLKELDTIETELDISEIEELEKDLDPSQFDVL